VKRPLTGLAQARDLLERAWEVIASTSQPDEAARAVSENRLLEQIEDFLRETKEC
jgi:hypothetical protein